jgi:hypothetical protein
MQYLRSAVIGLFIVIALGVNVAVQESGPTITIASSALAQAENGTVTSRVMRWTRARLEAAKKHWAEDQQRFSECTRELDGIKKKSGRRMSYHRQGHFLEKCMREKHSEL